MTVDERQRLVVLTEAATRVLAAWDAAQGHILDNHQQRVLFVSPLQYLRHVLHALASPSEGNKKGDERLTAWLIELPQVVTQSETLEPRWWHPRDGWTGNPNHAVRFARREDAWTYIHHAHQSDAFGFRSAVPAEHIWIGSSALASRPQEQPRKATGEMVSVPRWYLEQIAEQHDRSLTYHEVRFARDVLNAVQSVSPAAAQGWQRPDNEVLTLRAAYTSLFDVHARTLRRFPQLAIPEGTTPPEVVIFDGIKYRRALPAAPPSPAAQEQEKGEQS